MKGSKQVMFGINRGSNIDPMTMHFFMYGDDTSFCNRVVYPDWYKGRYNVIERVLGPIGNPSPRGELECQRCYDALLKRKADYLATEKVSRRSGESIITDSAQNH